MLDLRESRNSKISEQCEEPQALDQSKRVWPNKDFNWSKEHSISSNEWRFQPFQTVHIKQPSTKLHTSEPCFLNQFLQLNIKLPIDPGIIQLIPNSKSYSMLYARGMNSFPWKNIWRVKVPAKYLFFTWTAALWKIIMKDNTQKKLNCCGLVMYVQKRWTLLIIYL